MVCLTLTGMLEGSHRTNMSSAGKAKRSRMVSDLGTEPLTDPQGLDNG